MDVKTFGVNGALAEEEMEDDSEDKYSFKHHDVYFFCLLHWISTITVLVYHKALVRIFLFEAHMIHQT